MTEERTERFAVRMTPAEVDMLRQLAELDGFRSADVLRQLVRREYKQRIGDKPPKKSKK